MTPRRKRHLTYITIGVFFLLCGVEYGKRIWAIHYPAEVGALFTTVSSIRVSRVSVMVSVRDTVVNKAPTSAGLPRICYCIV